MNVNYQLKEMVDNMCDVIQTAADLGDMKMDIRTIAKAEIGMFMMYLSASDGHILWEEAKIISDVCDLNLVTPDMLGKFIRENNIYSSEFENKVPASFQVMVAADNAFIGTGHPEKAIAAEALLAV